MLTPPRPIANSKSSSLNTATQYLSSSSIYRSKGVAGDKALDSRISG